MQMNRIKKKLFMFLSLTVLLSSFLLFSGLTLPEMTTLGTGQIFTFEEGTTSGWDAMGPVTLQAVQEKSYSGSYSMKVAGRTSAWNGANLNLTGKILNGQKYNVSLYVYFENSGNDTETITVSGKKTVAGSDTVYFQVAAGNIPAAQWTKISADYTLSDSASPEYLSFYIESPNATLEYYIDDVCIVPVAVNSGFEDGTTNGWNVMGPITLTAVPGIAHSGNYSMMVSGRTSGWNGPEIDLTNQLVTGQEYYFSTYVYIAAGEAEETVNMTMKTKLQDSDTAYSYVTGSTIPIGQWTELKAPYTLNPAGTLESLSVYLESPNPTLEFYVDDFMIAGVNVQQNTNSNEILADIDFENGQLGGWKASASNVSLSVASDYAHTGTNSLLTTGRANTWEGPNLSMMGKMTKDNSYNVSLWVSQRSGADQKISLSMCVKADETSYNNLFYNITVPSDTWINLSKEYILTYTGTLQDLYLYVESPDAALDFYVDDVLITKKASSIEKDIPSLWEVYQDDFSIGAALYVGELSGGTASDLVKKHFNSITPGNDMKSAYIQPSEGNFNFTNSDKYIEFTQANGIKLRGHCLVWHSQVPDWIFVDEANNPVTRDVLLARMKAHIQTLVGRYKGKIYAWDVVNEAVDVSQPNNLRDTKWLQIIGPDYIEKAFEYAHEADPDARLFYNDYNTEESAKRTAIYNLVKGLKEKGVPIHGIGIQGHININSPTIDNIEYTLQKFSELGVELQVTELDMSIYSNSNASYTTPPENLLIQQAFKYKDLMKLFHKYRDVITNVTFWGTTDESSWLNDFGRKDFPLLFDADYKAKPAFWGIVDPAKLPVKINTAKSSDGSPVIDGSKDLLWDLSPKQEIKDLNGQSAGSFTTLWDSSNLYLYLKVNDPTSDANDSVEIYLDQNNAKSSGLDADDCHYTVTRSDKGGLNCILTAVDDGYILEAAIPLNAVTPAAGLQIGFGLKINNADTTTNWNDFTNSQNSMTKNYGIILLQTAPHYAEIKKGTPVIDGKTDILWDDAATIETLVETTGTDAATGKFKLLWDENYLYILGDIMDPVLSDINTAAYEQDSVEIFIDQNNGKTVAYEDNDAQYRVNYNNVQSFGNNADQENFITSTCLIEGGYRVEMAIPLNKIKGNTGNVMGFDIQINDDNGTGSRTGIRNWNDNTNSGWQNTEGYGVVRLIAGNPLIMVIDDKTVAIKVQGIHDGSEVTAEVSESLFNEAIQALVDKKHGTIRIEAPMDKDITLTRLTLPAQPFYLESNPQKCHPQKTKNFSRIVVTAQPAGFELEAEALKHQLNSSSQKIEFTLKSIDTVSLPEKIQKFIGDKPVIKIEAAIDGVSVDRLHGENNLKITYAYTFDDPKDSRLFIAAVVTNNNRIAPVTHVHYNSSTRQLSFNSDYFGQYIVIPIRNLYKPILMLF